MFVVEGPYDVMGDNWVSLVGTPSKAKVLELKPYVVYLVPDGDVWERKDLLKAWLRYWYLHPAVWGVLQLPKNMDPDEVFSYGCGDEVLRLVPVLTLEEAKRWLATS